MQMYNNEGFNENYYKSLIRTAKIKYRIGTYLNCTDNGNIVIFRHDIDLSPQRALNLAKIEHKEKITTTYFVDIHSRFYNAFEKTIANCIKDIKALGHNIGLHFDLSYYKKDQSVHNEALEKYLELEKNILENLLHISINVFSAHDPNANWLNYRQNTIAGMFNTYNKVIRSNFHYYSDSNYKWNIYQSTKSMRNILEEGNEEKIQILTHPGWWVNDLKSSSECITRCIKGRARNVRKEYENDVSKM